MEGERYDSQKLIYTGVVMGVIHVLAGPDHLSALATLSVGSSWRAALLGVRWGIGHSTGLVVVAVFFLGLKDSLDLKTIGKYADGIVGALMVILGLYGVYAAIKTYNEKHAKRSDDAAAIDSDFESRGGDHKSLSSHHSHDLRQCDLKDPTIQRIVAFIIGTVHGIGGPGGVLGVLPAVELNDWSAAVLYLVSFVLSSTVCMGGFAAFYGEATKRLGATADIVEFVLNLFSCGLSVVVGAIWVGFSIYGGREKLFH